MQAKREGGKKVAGWLLLDKPHGMTCTKLGAIIKRLVGISKVGHLGTLDPLATGVLPLALGDATRAIEYAEGWSKEYSFSMVWGESRTTEDSAGEIVATSDVRPSREAVEGTLGRFVGHILQQPPTYSAKKIKGVRAYDLARQGEAVELAPREVTVYSLKVIDWNESSATLSVDCGTGTYVRSITRDIAETLGAKARTRLGRFTLKDAITLEQLEKLKADDPSHWLEKVLLPTGLVADDYPRIELSQTEAERLCRGLELRKPLVEYQGEKESDLMRLEDRKVFKERGGGIRVAFWLNEKCMGVGEQNGEGMLYLRKLFRSTYEE